MEGMAKNDFIAIFYRMESVENEGKGDVDSYLDLLSCITCVDCGSKCIGC